MAVSSTAVKVILAFVTLLIGVLLIGPTSSEVLTKTEKLFANNESLDISAARMVGNGINTSYNFTVTNAPTSWKMNDCPLTNFIVRNQSGASLTNNGTHFAVILSNGKLSLQNTTNIRQSGSNKTSLDYNYCDDGYLTTQWQRTVTNTIMGFFAIGIMLVSVGLFYSVGKDFGLF